MPLDNVRAGGWRWPGPPANVPGSHPGRRIWVCFNGAAPLTARRAGAAVLGSVVSAMLQWGRAFDGAESTTPQR